MTRDRRKDSDKSSLEIDHLKEMVEDEEAFKLFDLAPLPYQSLDGDGNIVEANRAWLALLGYTRDEVHGTWFGDHLTVQSRELFKKRFGVFLAQGEVRSVEFTMIRKDGSRVLVNINGRIGYDEVGNFRQTHCIIHDITEKRRAEEDLANSEKQFRGLFESSIDGIIYSDINGTILTVNPATCAMLGCDKGELLGKNIMDITPEEWVAAEKDIFENQVLKVGYCDDFRKELYHVDGHKVPVSIRVWLSSNEVGEYVGSWAVIKDITAQLRAEAEVKASEQKYRDIFERSPEGLYQSTPDGRFLNANPAMAEIMGYATPEELLRSVTDIASQFYADPEERFRLIEKLAKDGEIKNFELRLRGRDGRVFWVSETARAVFNAAGDIVMYEGSLIDITQRKQTEEAFRLTQFSVDNAPIAIYWINEEGRFVYVNDQACASVGYTREEMLRMSVPDVDFYLRPEDWDERWKLRQSGDIGRLETAHKRRDGSVFPVGITSYYMSYGTQKLLFTYAYDLSEREQADAALKRTQELLNEAQRISLTGGWEVTVATGEVFWTEGQFRLHGASHGTPPQTMQEYFTTYVYPCDRAKVMRAWETILNDNVPAEIEYRVTKADGTVATFVTVGIPALGEDGQVARIYGSNRDVTLERQAASELGQAHQRLLTILDGIDADIYVSDIDDNSILFMNAHMRDNFGSLVPGAKCFEMFRGEEDQCPFCPKPDLLDAAGLPVQTIISERHNPLTGRWYLNHDRVIEWLEGKLVHMHMAADITDLKGMERSLKHAMAEAEAASTAKDEFLANMSHEIRTPLNGLLGMLQILQLTSLADEQKGYLTTAVDSGRNLLQVLNDILDLTKIESGLLDFDEYEMELGEVLDSVVTVFRHMADQRGVSMSWTIDETLPRHFLTDKGRIRQILFNLVGNAAKFTESGSVVVEAYPLPHILEDDRQLLFFSITDTGIGIPEDKLDRIFDPFTQVDGSFSRKYQGTGLGLGIVRRLVNLMGGSIAVSSQADKGTTMVFTIAVKPESAPDTPLDVSGAEEEHRRLSLLLAEDEHVNRIVAQRLLDKLGHDVVCVENGEKALELLGSTSFDCFLTDIQMPGLDGLETTRIIREKLGLDIPIIALTAHAMKGDRKRFLDVGMDGYISKPFEIKELQDELRRVMAESAN